MTYTTLSYEVTDGVALICLNRPEVHNAVNATMARELHRVWEQFNEDGSARVAILTGAGERAFCVGADMGDLPLSEVEDDSLDAFRWTAIQNAVWKPVICAVNGMTVGGGLHFVADSDIVIAAESASFFDTHVAVGLVAGLEPVTLARKMPMEAVMRMMLMGGKERMSAGRARELGLVGEVVPDRDLLAHARSLADSIKGHSPTAMARTKQAVWRGANLGLEDALVQAWEIIQDHNAHPDVAEGPRAFIEKRVPRWLPLDRES